MNDTRLFIGNLSYNTTEDDLRDCFAEAGTVTSVNLMMDKFTGKSRGFAFVEMASAAEAAKAIEMFHGKSLQDRRADGQHRPPARGTPPRQAAGNPAARRASQAAAGRRAVTANGSRSAASRLKKQTPSGHSVPGDSRNLGFDTGRRRL